MENIHSMMAILYKLVLIVFALSPDVFDLSLSDGCLQENENTTENGINPELAKVGYADCIIVLYCYLWLTLW